MENAPQFRPRALPMPKVGDRIIVLSTYIPTHQYEYATVFSVNKSIFYYIFDGGRKGYASLNCTWCYSDPAVEAQRLMEAAYRADTSPLPESLLEAIEMASEEGDTEADNVLAILIEQHPATIVFALVPHLLRWQAQQEGGQV